MVSAALQLKEFPARSSCSILMSPHDLDIPRHTWDLQLGEQSSFVVYKFAQELAKIRSPQTFLQTGHSIFQSGLISNMEENCDPDTLYFLLYQFSLICYRWKKVVEMSSCKLLACHALLLIQLMSHRILGRRIKNIHLFPSFYSL